MFAIFVQPGVVRWELGKTHRRQSFRKHFTHTFGGIFCGGSSIVASEICNTKQQPALESQRTFSSYRIVYTHHQVLDDGVRSRWRFPKIRATLSRCCTPCLCMLIMLLMSLYEIWITQMREWKVPPTSNGTREKKTCTRTHVNRYN